MISVGIIPIRSGSKRVANKALAVLNGHPLFFYALDAAEKSKLDRVIVSASASYVPILRAYRNECGWSKIDIRERSPENEQDGSTSESAMLEFTGDIERSDIVGLIQITNPFITAGEINKGLLMMGMPDYNSALSVCEQDGFFWTKSGPVNYVPESRPRSQEFENFACKEDGKFYLCRSREFLANRCRLVRPVALVRTAPSWEIDTPADVLLAQQMMEGQHDSC